MCVCLSVCVYVYAYVYVGMLSLYSLIVALPSEVTLSRAVFPPLAVDLASAARLLFVMQIHEFVWVTKRHLVEDSGTRLNGAEEKIQTIGVVVIGLVIICQTPFRLYFFVSEVLNDWNAELGMVTYLLFLANNLLNFPVYCAVFEGEKIMKNIKKITKYCAR